MSRTVEILEALDEDTYAARVRRRVRASIEAAPKRFREALEDGARWVWANPDGLTPQQAVDALGSTAAAVFAEHGAAYRFLHETSGLPPFIPPLMPVPNDDGTITLQPWPENPPEE